MTLVLAACGDNAKMPEETAFGPNPVLPEPSETIIPTIDIAPAKGWPRGASPAPAPGLSVQAFTGANKDKLKIKCPRPRRTHFRSPRSPIKTKEIGLLFWRWAPQCSSHWLFRRALALIGSSNI